MTITIKFTDSEARVARHYLKTRYQSKASFEKLAKLAIRTEVAARARIELDEAMRTIETEQETES